MRKRWSLLILFAVATALPAEKLRRKAPPEVEQSLRERVHAFYSYFQTGEYRKAEEFVDKDSRDLFYGAQKSRIIDFEIKNFEFSDNFKEARALVACSTIVPMLGSRPLTMPVSSDWVFKKGEWRMHLEERGSALRAKAASSPFGPMRFQAPSTPTPGAAGPGPTAPRPTLETLANMFRVSGDELDFPKTPEKPVTRTIKFKNQAQGVLTVERHTREIPGVQVSVEQAEVAPNGEIEIAFTYDPEVKSYTGRLRVDFMVLPLNQTFEVFLDF